MRVDSLLHCSNPRLLAEVMCPQQAEVIVRVAMVEGQDQVDQRLPAACRTPSLMPMRMSVRRWRKAGQSEHACCTDVP